MNDEVIKSKLALQIAQLSLDKATLEAQLEHLQAELTKIKEENKEKGEADA